MGGKGTRAAYAALGGLMPQVKRFHFDRLES